MTANQFRAWRAAMRFSQARAAAELGVSIWTVKNYDAGATRARDADGERVAVQIPRAIALACSALAAGLQPYGETKRPGDRQARSHSKPAAGRRGKFKPL